MAKTIRIGDQTAELSLHYANTTYILDEGRSIATLQSGIRSAGQAEGVSLEINGYITVAGAGIYWGEEHVGGAQIDISIGATGEIHAGNFGIATFGDNQRIENAGWVEAGGAILLGGTGSTVINSGQLVGEGYAINGSDGQTIKNSGIISADDVGIFLFGDGGAGNVIVNSGTISASLAIWGSGNDDRIVNSGMINGAIDMSGGNDTFTFKKGTLTAGVYGGEGNDTFVIRKAGIGLVEYVEEGYDTVKSSVSFTLGDHFEALVLTGRKTADGTGNDDGNEMTGNAGRNALVGGGGFDTLAGGRGNDVLTGGLDDDSFVFSLGTGRDTVTDFEIGADEIDLGGLKGAKNFDNMMGKHVQDKSGDVWITYGDDIVILRDIKSADLQSADFTF